jgi:coproporphyrinogen III oxidase
MSSFKEEVSGRFQRIQDEITKSLETLDGKAKFQEECWQREGGGGGRTRVIQNGDLIEKGGVNFSAVHGILPESLQKSFQVEETEFFATGVSIVLHAHHPMVPIIHMNVRYFELNEQIRWFGGGIDVTPHYVKPEEASAFHQTLKDVCDQYEPSFYSEFKNWADRYFYIPHRQETRGIGGIFYDRLQPAKTNLSWSQLADFSIDLAKQFVPIYTNLAQPNRSLPITDAQRHWQAQRRGRYVEFNLVYDAGTKFGLETNGRIESILMSLPPMAQWPYQGSPLEGSPEAETLKFLKQGINWI